MVQGVLPDRLGLPESQKSPKKVVQKRQNLSYSMIFTTKKTSNKKMSIGKKFILRMSIQKSKPKKIGLKRPIFWCTLIQAVEVKLFGLFSSKCSSDNKTFTS